MRDRLDLSSAVSLESSEMDQIILTGYLPQGDIVLQGPVSAYFCGEKRCNSPFAPKKPMQSPSEAALLNCMESDCRELSLKAQFLHQLPDISMLAQKLTVLNLSFNMLKILPSSIFAATNLEELYLRNNPLLLLSDEIGKFTRLHILSASFCLLEDLPLSIYKLSHLRELDVSYNRIRRISHNISDLRRLVFLNLEGNELPGLPAEFIYLKDLKYLRTNSNFMHPLICRDYINRHPDHLQDICLRFLLREFYDDDMESMPPNIYEFSNLRYHQCANCELIFFGSGKELIIPSLTPDHAVNSFPVLHNVCAERCVPFLREKLKQN